MADANPACGTMVSVKLRSVSGDEHELTVTMRSRLRDVQETVCRVFRKSFPSTKVCLARGTTTFDEFTDLPFVGCVGGDVLAVVFMNTDDPYFYDLRDRRTPRPCTPPLELENELAVSQLELPPPMLD